MISRHTILNKFDYDEKTGDLTWKFTHGRCRKGSLAGWICSSGVRRVRVDGKEYQITNIIWMYCHGRWPKKKVLFKDGDNTNYRLENLRDSGADDILTQERLKQLIDYDPDTGVFTWKGPSRFSGEESNCYNVYGYKVIGVDGKRYQASRLAWLYMEGYWPEHEIDHINRDPSDNRWCNLRHTSKQCNVRNRGVNKNNTSGVTGVSRNSRNGRWYVEILDKNVGSYKNLDQAVKARWEAEVRHGFKNCQTTSSAYLYLKDKGLI